MRAALAPPLADKAGCSTSSTHTGKPTRPRCTHTCARDCACASPAGAGQPTAQRGAQAVLQAAHGLLHLLYGLHAEGRRRRRRRVSQPGSGGVLESRPAQNPALPCMPQGCTPGPDTAMPIANSLASWRHACYVAMLGGYDSAAQRVVPAWWRG